MMIMRRRRRRITMVSQITSYLSYLRTFYGHTRIYIYIWWFIDPLDLRYVDKYHYHYHSFVTLCFACKCLIVPILYHGPECKIIHVNLFPLCLSLWSREMYEIDNIKRNTIEKQNWVKLLLAEAEKQLERDPGEEIIRTNNHTNNSVYHLLPLLHWFPLNPWRQTHLYPLSVNPTWHRKFFPGQRLRWQKFWETKRTWRRIQMFYFIGTSGFYPL